MKWWHVALPAAGLAAGLWALHIAPDPAKPAPSPGPKPPPAPPGPAPAAAPTAASAPASKAASTAPAASATKGRAPGPAPASAPGAGLPAGFNAPPGASAARGLETLGKPGGPPGPSILDSLVPGASAPATGPGTDVPAVVLPEKKEGKDGEVVTISETATEPTLADKLADVGLAALPGAWSGIVPGDKPSGTDGAP